LAYELPFELGEARHGVGHQLARWRGRIHPEVECHHGPVLETGNGGLWFSRLRETDPRAGTPYEQEYGYWIPGDACDALKAVFVFATDEQVPIVRSMRS
jgi:hypothetical protein